MISLSIFVYVSMKGAHVVYKEQVSWFSELNSNSIFAKFGKKSDNISGVTYSKGGSLFKQNSLYYH